MPSGFTYGKLCVVVFLVLETQAKWSDDKHSHRPLHMTTDELRQFVYTSEVNRTSFESLLDPILIRRAPGSENNKVVREYIKNHMSNLGWSIETDAFTDNTPNGQVNFENIITTLNPETPRRLVLACHYDSKYFPENNFIGATDSAVPCAMMLYLASVLKKSLNENKQRARQNVTLQFVFFDGEEAFKDWSDVDSLYGSRHLAALWEKTPYPTGNVENTNYLHRMDKLVLLDLVGTSNPSFSNFFKSTAHWYNDLVQIEVTLRNNRMWAGNPRGNTHFQTGPAHEGIEDDHLPFMQRNVDIVHLIVSPFPKVWHTPKDNKEALDFTTIANLNKVLQVFVATLTCPRSRNINTTPFN
ncbi:unnamed protein product [Allacma fusca]|uniref:Glutaminyl-peptide cyclotransferase n=1 Tax=Allacma fusca TaxID=39272 RepID=A0A8J2JJC6_9HEXA|nr:unnamed protein product [Allacma fusca]